MEQLRRSKISIIIPVYNAADYIVQCIDSLARQSFADVEFICVDDCSTDNSLEVLQEYAKGDSRVQVIHFEQNQGVSVARNVGIEAAGGSYILFVDSDDYHVDGSLQRLYEEMKIHDLDIIQFELEAFHTSGNPGFINMNPAARMASVGKILTGAEMLTLQAAEKGEYSCSVVLQMFRADFLKDSGVRFFPGIIHEDELFTPMILDKAQRVMCINDRLYKRRIRSNSIMTTALTHRNADGYFVVATELMAKYIAGGCWNEGMGIRAKAILGSSLNRYKMLSDEEKQLTGKDIPEIHRFLFERSMVRIEDEKNRVSQLQQQIKAMRKLHNEETSALKKKNVELNKAHADLNKAHTDLKKAYADMENSVSYKVGRIITSIPRKLRDYVKRIFKK